MRLYRTPNRRATMELIPRDCLSLSIEGGRYRNPIHTEQEPTVCTFSRGATFAKTPSSMFAPSSLEQKLCRGHVIILPIPRMSEKQHVHDFFHSSVAFTSSRHGTAEPSGTGDGEQSAAECAKMPCHRSSIFRRHGATRAQAA